MSLHIAEGFNAFPTSGSNHAPRGKSYVSSGGSWRISTSYSNADGTAAGRTGSGRSKVISTQPLRIEGIYGPVTMSTIYLGVGIYRHTNSATETSFLSIRNGTDTADHVTFALAGSNGQDLRVYGAGGTTLFTVSGVFPLDTWVWITAKVVIHDSAGEVTVKDGSLTTLGSATGVDTQASTATTLAFIFNTGAHEYRIDDLLIADGSGSRWNDYIPDMEILTYVAGTGATTNSYGTIGNGAGVTAIDELDADEDSTIWTDGQYSMSRLAYAFQDTTPTNVRGLGTELRIRANDTTTRRATPGVYLSTSNDGAAYFDFQNSYASGQYIAEVNPETGANWTGAQVDAAELYWVISTTSLG
jgi:hypothetical protein